MKNKLYVYSTTLALMWLCSFVFLGEVYGEKLKVIATPLKTSEFEVQSANQEAKNVQDKILPSILEPYAKVLPQSTFGIKTLWQQGDAAIRGAIILLLLMSITTWYVAVVKLIEQRQMLKLARQILQPHKNKASINPGDNVAPTDSKQVKEVIGKSENPYYNILIAGQQACLEVQTAKQLDPDTWIAGAIVDAVSRVNAQLQSGLTALATVGATAPFIGLFGTVWGIYHALIAIGISGQASIDTVAGPVGEALIMTAMGLVVAVPAVFFYNWLLRRNRRIIDLAHLYGDKLHVQLVMVAVK